MKKTKSGVVEVRSTFRREGLATQLREGGQLMASSCVSLQDLPQLQRDASPKSHCSWGSLHLELSKVSWKSLVILAPRPSLMGKTGSQAPQITVPFLPLPSPTSTLSSALALIPLKYLASQTPCLCLLPFGELNLTTGWEEIEHLWVWVGGQGKTFSAGDIWAEPRMK